MRPLPRPPLLCAPLIAALLGLPACSKQGASSPDSALQAAANEDSAARHVKLTPQIIASMGIRSVPAQAAQYSAEIAGYAVVLGHDAIAQAVADAATAEAQSRQSHAALARLQGLVGTAGAEPAEVREAAARQAETDEIAVNLAQRRLSGLLGQHPPWAQRHDAELQAVAAGRTKIARVSFPLGSIRQTPRTVRLARLDAPTVQEQWHSRAVWGGPADPGMPGRSYLALLPDAPVEEGEHLSAWAPDGSAGEQSGAWVPAAAALAEGGRYWLYVQHQEGEFERVPLDIGRPLREGYFLRDLRPGEQVVTVGAGLLLAKELNPETESGD